MQSGGVEYSAVSRAPALPTWDPALALNPLPSPSPDAVACSTHNVADGDVVAVPHNGDIVIA